MRFVIVVDTQWDFMAADGALSVAGAEPLTGAMQTWLVSLDPAETVGVLFTFDTHLADVYPGSSEAGQFPIHCIQGTTGWTNVLDGEAIDPAIPVYCVEKGVFDMWAEPGLLIEDARDPIAPTIDRDAFFSTLRKTVEEVTVIGVSADYCVRWAIDGLVARGFRVTVPAGLTRGIERPIETVLAEDFAGAAVVLA